MPFILVNDSGTAKVATIVGLLDGVTVELQHITIGDATNPNLKTTVTSEGSLQTDVVGVTTVTFSTVDVVAGITPTQLVAADTVRKRLTIQNYSAAGTNTPVFYGNLSGITPGSGIALFDGDVVHKDNFRAALHAVLGAGVTTAVTIGVLEEY